jgi:hypothetical protein
MTALFESKEELKFFVLDVIETSPLSGRVDKLTDRVDKLTGRFDEMTEMLKQERADGEQRDLKLNVIYDGVLALLDASKKIHVTPRRGRPKRIREGEAEES